MSGAHDGAEIRGTCVKVALHVVAADGDRMVALYEGFDARGDDGQPGSAAIVAMPSRTVLSALAAARRAMKC